jgi:hypothetical protein
MRCETATRNFQGRLLEGAFTRIGLLLLVKIAFHPCTCYLCSLKASGLQCVRTLTNHLGVSINPVAELQPATLFHSFNILLALNMVRMRSVRIVLQTHARNIETGVEFSCILVRILLSVGFSYSFTFRCAYVQHDCFTPTKERFSCRY